MLVFEGLKQVFLSGHTCSMWRNTETQGQEQDILEPHVSLFMPLAFRNTVL